MNSNSAICLRNLTTGYPGGKTPHVVSSGLDAELRCGEVTCLLGSNGAGKSTLLSTVSGFLPPLGGEVLVHGRSIATLGARELSRLVGVVLTDRSMTADLTLRQVVELGRSPYTGFWGRLSGSDNAAVDEAIAMMGLEELAHRAVGTLSDGERQKTFIAKAIAQHTPVIILDEPTAFLDYPSKVEIMQLLGRLARSTGKTVFLSTHDLDMALQLCDNAWLLDRRLGLVTGTPAALGASGAIGAYFNRGGVSYDASTLHFTINRQ